MLFFDRGRGSTGGIATRYKVRMVGRPRKRRGPRGAFANRLREARTYRELSQQALADQLGIHQVTIANWETGAAKPQGLARRYVEDWIDRVLEERKSRE